MRLKLTNSMNKCIGEMKERALYLINDIPLYNNLKIEQKVTKNKTFEFHIINLRKPIIKLFVNGRLFRTYIYSNSNWSEST